MSTRTRNNLIIGCLFLAVLAVVAGRHLREKAYTRDMDYRAALASGLPVLLEFGRGTCTPCKAMMPVLAGLKRTYQGKLSVGFVDTGLHPTEAEKYNIRQIPTQIFLEELFRHVGFFAGEDIIAKWKELGVELDDRP